MNGALRLAGLAALLTLSLGFVSGCVSDPPNRVVDPVVDSAVDPAVGGQDAVDPQSEIPEAAAVEAPTTLEFGPAGSISDTDLARYHVSMSCAIDGKDIGTMTFEMWSEGAPITTRNFMRLCSEGFYDGIAFHRIMRDFMVQGGDPTGTGGGNSPHGTIKAEFSTAPDRKHGYGVLSMARLGHDDDSASCQFFLCCDENRSVWGLDGKYTSFGKLTSGVPTLEAIANVPTRKGPRGEPSVPTQKAIITKATVIEGPAPTGETIKRP